MKIKNKLVVFNLWPVARKPDKDTPRTILADIPVGTVFCGYLHEKYRVLLRDYIGLVDLENPNDTWKYSPEAVFIMGYMPLDVELEIKLENIPEDEREE